jgi:anti-sigma factor RsiW
MSTLSDKELLDLHELLDALVEGNLPRDKLSELERWIGEDENVIQSLPLR